MIKTAAFVLILVVVGSGGDPVNATDGSFVVDVRRNYFFFHKHLCNGALIDERWVLVPASCVSSSSFFGTLEVVVGSKVIKTQNIVAHENFTGLTHNIALIRLALDATFEETGAQPIKIPPTNVEIYGETTLYKRSYYGEIETSIVNIIDLSACSHAPGELGYKYGHLCAGDEDSKAVKGDEGSALVIDFGMQGQTVIALLSYAKSEPASAVYTRVAFYSTWIWVKQILGSQ